MLPPTSASLTPYNKCYLQKKKKRDSELSEMLHHAYSNTEIK